MAAGKKIDEKLVRIFIPVLLIRRLKRKMTKASFEKFSKESGLHKFIPMYEAFVKAEKTEKEQWKECLEEMRLERLEATKKNLREKGLAIP